MPLCQHTERPCPLGQYNLLGSTHFGVGAFPMLNVAQDIMDFNYLFYKIKNCTFKI